MSDWAFAPNLQAKIGHRRKTAKQLRENIRRRLRQLHDYEKETEMLAQQETKH